MMERTLVLVKHDGVQRGLVGELIQRFEHRGLKIAGIKMVQPTTEMAQKHYVMTEAWIKKLATNTRAAAEKKGLKIAETDEQIARKVQGWNISYLVEGPVVAIVFEGYHALEVGRKIVGPACAKDAGVGTFRGDYTVESYDLADAGQRTIRSIVHASGNQEEADNEISLWFKKNELFDYELYLWRIMHKK
ncbi:MAG: nucleoside-diphosphate kinase [Candidatus Woesearchaeota archaeon]